LLLALAWQRECLLSLIPFVIFGLCVCPALAMGADQRGVSLFQDSLLKPEEENTFMSPALTGKQGGKVF